MSIYTPKPFRAPKDKFWLKKIRISLQQASAFKRRLRIYGSHKLVSEVKWFLINRER